MESYTGLSEIYDRMIEIDYDKWADFVAQYMNSKGVGLRGKRLLELGCGTGNMTLRLKAMGMDVTALDISNDMLQAAHQKSLKKRSKILFVNQNMINFNINKKFDFIFSFCDGYNYITKEEDIMKSFERVYGHMNAGGYFLFDISTSFKLKKCIGNGTFTQNNDEMSYIWDNYLEDDILEMYITFFIQEGVLYRRFKEHHIQKTWETGFMAECLKNAGFSDINIYDDYSVNNINEKSMRATFICKREE